MTEPATDTTTPTTDALDGIADALLAIAYAIRNTTPICGELFITLKSDLVPYRCVLITGHGGAHSIGSDDGVVDAEIHCSDCQGTAILADLRRMADDWEAMAARWIASNEFHNGDLTARDASQDMHALVRKHQAKP